MGPSAHYAIRLGPFGPRHVRVESLRGREALSSLYRFDVVVTTLAPREAFERAVFARRAVLAIHVAGHRRLVHGIVTRVRFEGVRRVTDRDFYQYTIRLSPRAALLQHRSGSRIFRDASAAEVLGEVIGGARVDARFELRGKSPARDYLTQYEETDWAFVRRLAAENGLLFYFRQPDDPVDAALDDAISAGLDALPEPVATVAGALLDEFDPGPGESIVFTDGPTYLPLGGSTPGADAIPYRTGGALEGIDRESVLAFDLSRDVRPTSASYGDYDPVRPRTLLEAALAIGDLADAPRLAAGGMDGLPEPSELEVVAHGGRHLFPEFDEAKEETARMLRQLRRRARVGRGTGVGARFEPGRWFVLEDHPEASGPYAITRVRHTGTQAWADGATTGYSCEFECVPSDVAYLPKAPPRRVVQACVTATVVGPPGQDVHTNERGDVRVRFHWDRRRETGDASSAWIRTMHAWSGTAWGTQFIPRVGSEVVVVFESGDPDKPLVLGSLYNGVLPTPFALPRDATRSGIRTQSTPGGGGFNELSFEDAKDREQIYLRAQRDFDSVVERSRTAVVRAEDRTTVDGDRLVEVGGTMRSVAKKDRETEVRGDDRVHVHGSRSVGVDGDLQEHVARERSVRVEQSDRREVVGESLLLVHGDVLGDVRGSAAILIGREDAKRSLAVRVEGVTTVSGSDAVDVGSDEELLLRSGSSFIRITPGGIEIAASKVTVRGKDARILLDDGTAKIKTKTTFQVVSDDKVVLKSSGASVGLGSEAKIDGSRVLLNSPEQATDSIEVNDPQPTTIQLVDQDGNAVPYQRFRLILDDGSEHTGFLDASGQAQVQVSSNGQIVWPDLADADQG